MNQNQTVSIAVPQVVVVQFSIYGVNGFTTVQAEGASVNKRIRSALKQLERDNIDRLKHPDSAEAHLERETLKKGELILRKVFRDANGGNEFANCEYTKDLETIDTEVFFERGHLLYKANYQLFFESIPEIFKKAFPHSEAPDSLAEAQTHYRYDELDESPILYEATGGMFQDSLWTVILSPKDVYGLGKGDASAAVQELCARSLRMWKNFRLSDYLRAENDEMRQNVQDEIRYFDSIYPSLAEITVRKLGPIFPPSSYAPSPKQVVGGEDVLKFVRVLVQESIRRLEQQALAMIRSNYRHAGEKD